MVTPILSKESVEKQFSKSLDFYCIKQKNFCVECPSSPLALGVRPTYFIHIPEQMFLRRSPDSTGQLFLLFFFQFSFFLWTKMGLFLLFPFAFIFFPLITHIYFSLLENDLRRIVAANGPRFIRRAAAGKRLCSKNKPKARV